MRRRMAVLALLALVAGSASACSGGASASPTSVRVDPVQATTLHTGDISLRIPPGSASGGTVTLSTATPPEQVPTGLKPLGPAAAVLLAGGTLTAPATLSFPAPDDLRRGDLPVMVWRTGDSWTWLPTSWHEGDRTVDVSFTQASAGYLAVVDVDSWVESFRRSFVDTVTTAADASPPYCAGQAEAASAGLASGSDPGRQVRWCVGIEDGQPVLRAMNDTKLVTEVTFPDDWQVAAGEGARGSAVRAALGLGAGPPAGRAARYLGGGETLTLHPVPGSTVVGDVTAELTPTAWLVSSLLAAADAYAEVQGAADRRLGKAAATAAHRLPTDLAGGLTPSGPGAPSLRALHDCLSGVTDLPAALDPPTETRLLRAAVHCAPHYVAKTLGRTPVSGPGTRLADHAGRIVLNGLLRSLSTTAPDWDATPGTTAASAFRIWLGPPPPQELDYESAPKVFHVGGTVDEPAWTPEFQAYVRERLDYLVTSGDASAGCAQGTFTVRRYRSDGFALAGQVSCDGVPHQLVLGKLADGWHEIDDTPSTADEPGHYFSCDLMRLYSVPAFIVGDQCISGSAVQDYP